MVTAIATTLMIVSAIILILVILVQRGKGGGLAGAFGGMGGQSALGAKAGDTFTRITIGVAVLWFFSCVVSIWALNAAKSQKESEKESRMQMEQPADTTPPASATPSGDPDDTP